MDLRNLSSTASYAPPHCFELCGRQYALSLMGENEKLVNVSVIFADFPSKELSIAGETLKNGTFFYDCTKVSDSLFCVSYHDESTCVLLVLDISGKLAFLMTAAVDDDLRYAVFSGMVSEKNELTRKTLSDEFVGNTVDWTVGEGCTVRVKYEKENTAELSYNTRRTANVPCGVYRICDSAYFQYIYIKANGEKRLFMTLCSFTNMLGAGAVFGIADGEIQYNKIGCYGKIFSYTEEM